MGIPLSIFDVFVQMKHGRGPGLAKGQRFHAALRSAMSASPAAVSVAPRATPGATTMSPLSSSYALARRSQRALARIRSRACARAHRGSATRREHALDAPRSGNKRVDLLRRRRPLHERWPVRARRRTSAHPHDAGVASVLRRSGAARSFTTNVPQSQRQFSRLPPP